MFSEFPSFVVIGTVTKERCLALLMRAIFKTAAPAMNIVFNSFN